MSSDGTISRFELYLVLVKNLAQHPWTSFFPWNRMNIYKVPARATISNSPTPRSRFVETFSSSSPSETHERIRSGFPFLFYMTKNFFRNGISNLEWNCWETHAGVCTVTVIVIRRISIEGNIMMTLKLDMKHISEREGKMSGGSGCGGRWGLREGGELRASLRTGSRCKGLTVPLWSAWFYYRSHLVSHPGLWLWRQRESNSHTTAHC